MCGLCRRSPRRSLRAASRGGRSVLALEDISVAFGGVVALRDVRPACGGGRNSRGYRPERSRQEFAAQRHERNIPAGSRSSAAWATRDFTHVPTSRLAAFGVARTFQNLALFKGLSVLDNMMIGRCASAARRLLRTDPGTSGPRARRKRPIRAARGGGHELPRISPRQSERIAVGTLPYGLQKRVELARALVASAEALVARRTAWPA